MDVLLDETEIACNLAAWAAHVTKIRVIGSGWLFLNPHGISETGTDLKIA